MERKNFIRGFFCMYRFKFSPPRIISWDNFVPSNKTAFLWRTETVKQLPFISYLHEKGFLKVFIADTIISGLYFLKYVILY